MKNFSGVCFLLIFLIFPIYSQDLASLEISGNYSDQEIRQVLDDLENKYPIHFYYKADWLPAKRVTIDFFKTPIYNALDKLLKNTQLTFRFYYNYAIIISDSEAFKDFSQDYYLTKKIEDSEFSSVEGKNIPIVTLGKVSSENFKGNIRISGTVTDGENNDLLPGVVLQIIGTGISTSSDGKGNFVFEIPKGNYLTKISSIGYQPAYINIKVLSNDNWNIQIFSEAFELEEVIIREQPDDSNIRNLQAGLVKLSALSIQQLPTFLGEADVVRSLLTLPGISTVGEGATGFNVRGGNVDQNLILLDESIVFNSSHLLGFFSAFNADAIEEVNLYKGNIPAHYGGRLSSVLDIKSKKGNYNELRGTGGLGVVSSRLTLDGPIVKDKTAFLVSARASYSDWVLNLMKNVDLKNSSAYFYDFNSKINHKIKKGTISLSYYQNYDKFRFSDQYGFSWGSQTASLNWNQVYSPEFSSSFTAVYGNLNNQFFEPEGYNGFSLNSGLSYYKAKQNFSFSLVNRLQVNAGLEGVRYYGKPEIRKAEGRLSEVVPGRVEKDNGQELGVYLDNEFEINPYVSVSAGLRFSYFQHFGPKQVFIYEEGLSKNLSSQIDTLHFSSGQGIKNYGGLEPRLSMKILLSTGSSIKLSYNRLFQYIHLISNTTSAIPMDIWQVSNYYIPPKQSDNYSIGFFRNLKNNIWETSIEGFYRNIHNLVEYKDLPVLILNPAIETELMPGIGKAYGWELFIKKKAGVINGWLSYTYSRSLRKIEPEYSEESVNLGEWYPANFDQPHNLNVVFNAEFNTKHMFSANFTYNTGRPITAPVTSYFVNSVLIPHYSDRNQYRIPDFHRLDLSFTLKTSPFRRQKYKGSFTFSIYNVYARKNAFSVYFKRDLQNTSNAVKLSVLGSAFPAVTYNFNF